MKRDMDFIRNLLLRIEGGEKSFVTASSDSAEFLGLNPDDCPSREDVEKLLMHLDLLEDAGFAKLYRVSCEVHVQEITWKGHDFLDGVRDDKIWSETKDTAKKIGGWSADILLGIAKAYVKAKAAELGFPIA